MTRRYEVFHMDTGAAASFHADEDTALRFRSDLNATASKGGDKRAPFHVWDSVGHALVGEG